MKAVGIPLQYACFECRKSFKRPQFSGSNNRYMTVDQKKAQLADVEDFEDQREYKCPDCGGPAHFMGQDFKAPKRKDEKAWRKVQQFIESGKIYYRGTNN